MPQSDLTTTYFHTHLLRLEESVYNQTAGSVGLKSLQVNTSIEPSDISSRLKEVVLT